MKKYYVAIGIICAINLIVTTVFVLLLPDQVPAHFGASGDGDRMGSKYEDYILTAIAIGLAIVSIADGRTSERSNTKTALKVGIALQVFFLAFNVVVALNQMAFATAGTVLAAGVNISQISLVGVGGLLIALGNVMPKSTINSTFGVRLPWTTESDEVWRKSQRFGGYVSVACGLVLIVCGIALSGYPALIALMVVFAVWILSCGIGSFVFYKREQG